MATHGMIDIESLDTVPGAAVLSIGACKFNPYTFEDTFDNKHWRINVDDQLAAGRSVSESTKEFWAKQPTEVQDAAFSPEGRIELDVFFKELNKWCVGLNDIWCQGPQFDMVILEDLYRSNNMHWNWPFWAIRDSRTLFQLPPQNPYREKREGLHDALADSIWQARCVQKVFMYFEIKEE